MKQKKDIDIRLFVDAVCEKKILKQFHENQSTIEMYRFLLFKLSYPLTYCVSNKRNSILLKYYCVLKLLTRNLMIFER